MKVIQINKSWICRTHFTDEKTEAWRCGKTVPELAGGGERGGGGGPACLPASAFIVLSTWKLTRHLAPPSPPPSFVPLSMMVTSHGITSVTIPRTHKLAEQPALTLSHFTPRGAPWCYLRSQPLNCGLFSLVL